MIFIVIIKLSLLILINNKLKTLINITSAKHLCLNIHWGCIEVHLNFTYPCFFRSVLSARQSYFAARSSLWARVWRRVVHSSLFHQREHTLTSPAVEAYLFLSSLWNVGPPGPHGLSCNLLDCLCLCVYAWGIPHITCPFNVPLSSLFTILQPNHSYLLPCIFFGNANCVMTTCSSFVMLKTNVLKLNKCRCCAAHMTHVYCILLLLFIYLSII